MDDFAHPTKLLRYTTWKVRHVVKDRFRTTRYSFSASIDLIKGQQMITATGFDTAGGTTTVAVSGVADYCHILDIDTTNCPDKKRMTWTWLSAATIRTLPALPLMAVHCRVNRIFATTPCLSRNSTVSRSNLATAQNHLQSFLFMDRTTNRHEDSVAIYMTSVIRLAYR